MKTKLCGPALRQIGQIFTYTENDIGDDRHLSHSGLNFAVHSYENKPYYFPSVESGKFYEKDGRLFMPLSITCHHATTDGWHINQFLKSLQLDADRFEIFL